MASYDLKIVGGTILDGSGAARFQGDVAIKDGLIVAVGDTPGAARRTLDARGALVTPGFTDIHTHYDGQVSWDAELAPSSCHGVTTAVMGSCGVGFAPVRPADHQKLIWLMEGVEDIPGTALAEGLTWDWESFPEYMAALDRRPHAIDFAAQVPHDALRVYVMGERAIADEAATEADRAEMARLLREALLAGAAGFSTGRTDNHRSVKGAATPASEASREELVALARAFVGLPHGVLQAVSDFDMATGPGRFDAEFDLLEALAAEAGGHPLSISLMQRDQAPGQWQRIIGRAEAANAAGLPIRLQVGARAIGVMLGLDATFHPFIGFPSYKAISHLPLDERVRRLSDPALKAKMMTERSEPVAGDGSPIPPLADQLLAHLDQLAFRLFRLGTRPDYEPNLAKSLGMMAKVSGRPVLDVMYDALLEDDGHALLYFPLYNYGSGDLSTVATMLNHPLALPGLSDGGAHVGTVCDASMPTFFLTHWGRDRAEGRLPLERIVRMQAFDTARYMGFADRGAVAVGQRADLNVIDFDRLRLAPPRMFADLPKGGKRLLQSAEGYVATLVAGQLIAENDTPTGARPGRLARPTGPVRLPPTSRS